MVTLAEKPEAKHPLDLLPLARLEQFARAWMGSSESAAQKLQQVFTIEKPAERAAALRKILKGLYHDQDSDPERGPKGYKTWKLRAEVWHRMQETALGQLQSMNEQMHERAEREGLLFEHVERDTYVRLLRSMLKDYTD